MDLYTQMHVIISLVGIASGLVVLLSMLRGSDKSGWTTVFLISTVATSATGFGFPIHGWTPALAFGVISLIVLAFAIAARYAFRLAGHWRWIFVVTSVVAICVNVFVLVLQSFLNVLAVRALVTSGTVTTFRFAGF